MDLYAVLDQIIDLLDRRKRLTYHLLKLQFHLDDEQLDALKDEILFAYPQVVEENERGLVWTGESVLRASQSLLPPRSPEQYPCPESSKADDTASASHHVNTPHADAERRQLTVMFCDLVGSTQLSGQLDPEDLREVVRAYQVASADVIQYYKGHIAQYLGDGLLIYFGYPIAHEDDAPRAVHAGLGIVETVGALNSRLDTDYGVQLSVRVGIHTGPVVVGEMGVPGQHEHLAMGETPNIAARLEGLAPPNEVVMSAATAQLVQRHFILEELGSERLKGVDEPMHLARVIGHRERGHGTEEPMVGGFESLLGRDEEIGLLHRRWEQSKAGHGQVVLLRGEAGIGKSSLVEGLRHHVGREDITHITFRCSPYHRSSAFYPIIESVQRALDWQPDDTAETRLAKLEQALAETRLALEEAVPLLGTLLSLNVSEGHYPASTQAMQQQRQQTQDILVAWLLDMAERQPVLAVWEDLHWADPSTLEVLGLCIEQSPTVAMCQVLTFRSEFEPPWPPRSHSTPISLNRLEQPQVEALIARLAKGKALPIEVVDHIVSKTDGVPLYVEELTKTLLASDLLRREDSIYVLNGSLNDVSIPATLQDSLMARIDQLGRAREIAQLGAVIGREFSYAMLQSLSEMEAETLDKSLNQLVDAELLHLRGRPPRAVYIFKHALIQDAAYQSLLRRRRQQLHQRIAELLETQFSDKVAAQPELIAHHYTAAGVYPKAVEAWQRAGAHALARVAYREAALSIEYAIDAQEQLPASQQSSELAIDLRLMSRNAHYPLANHDRVLARLREAEAIAKRVGDQWRLGQVLTRMSLSFFSMTILDRAVETGQRALAIADAHVYEDLRAIASIYLSGCYQALGNYQRAIDLATPIVHSLVGDLAYEFYGLEVTPAVTGRGLLGLSLSEIGHFSDAMLYVEQAMRIADELDHSRTQTTAYLIAGMILLRRGHISQALPLLEQAVKICRDANITVRFASAAAALSCAYAHTGQVELARQLLDDISQSTVPVGFPSLSYTVEAPLLTGRSSAYKFAMRSLDMARDQNIRGEQAHVLRLLGDHHRRRDADDADQAESFYRQALSTAQELGMRPLQAHCHLGLGTLYSERGERELAWQELSKAQALYRDMEMTFWLPSVEAVMSHMEGQ